MGFVLDTNGDGEGDSLLVDTTGDGKLDDLMCKWQGLQMLVNEQPNPHNVRCLFFSRERESTSCTFF